MGLKIGDLARATGTSAPTIRYYEDIGLLPAPPRVGGQRSYGPDDVRRLTFIRRCRDFGFPITQVRSLVTIMEDSERPCREARRLAEAHLDAVRRKLAELRTLEDTIVEFLDAASCEDGSGVHCEVLEELAEPVRQC